MRGGVGPRTLLWILGTRIRRVKVYSACGDPMRILVLTTAGLVVAAVLAARFLAPRSKRAAQRRFESFFRKPEKPPRPPDSGHYYKRYWE